MRILELPVELQDVILSHLDVKSLQTASASCKHFYETIRSSHFPRAAALQATFLRRSCHVRPSQIEKSWVERRTLDDFIEHYLMPTYRELSATKCTQEQGQAVFLQFFDYSALTVDEVLHSFFSIFTAPGECCSIDRILSALGNAYAEMVPPGNLLHNQGDAVYVLCYSIMMLNTDTVSPLVLHKMKEDDFVRANSGIYNGGDFDEAFLRALYRRIVSNPMTLHRDGPSARPKPKRQCILL